jgi:hypothetical protein
MNFWDRVGRVFEALDNKGHYGASAFGLSGTLEGKTCISQDDSLAFFDPVVPSRENKPFSIPAIIWSNGSIFCVDFRNWKGNLSYAPITETKVVKKKFLFWEYDAEE